MGKFKKSLTGLGQPQLRIFLSIFFITLLIPTVFLINHAYTQLKLAAFHQHRIMAEELTARINNKLTELLYNEESRPFTDYSFLNVAGDPVANFLQRSPLSSFPVNTNIPGIIGYFQIDHTGGFSTPLLPQRLPKVNKYGLTKKNIAQRLSLADKIKNILSKNLLAQISLVIESRDPIMQLASNLSKPVTTKLKPNSPKSANVETAIIPTNKPQNNSQTSSMTMTPSLFDFIFSASDELEIIQNSHTTSDNKLTQNLSTQNDTGLVTELPQTFIVEIPPTSLENLSVNDELVNPIDPLTSLSQSERHGLEPQQKNIEIDSIDAEKNVVPNPTFQINEANPEQQFIAANDNNHNNNKKRTELSVLPEQLLLNENTKSNINPIANELEISVFESQVDSFEFMLLDNGQFVFYRKVWRNGKRYVQGLLINAQKFFQDNIELVYRNTALSKISNLAITYQNNLVTLYSEQPTNGEKISGELLQGTLLYKSHLVTPLKNFELIYNIQQIPTGPAGSIIAWLSLILFFILSVGLYLIYRLVLSQINLSKQQQDFVSAVSHELKTPLTSIRMYGEMLKNGWASENKKIIYYDYIFDESERLSRLINNVLQLSSITRNDLQVDLKPISINEIMNSIQSKISSQIERAGFNIVFDIHEDIKDTNITISVDMFTQIVINLIDNAIKFSAKADTKKIIISCTLLDNNTVQIAIRDHGPGIAKDQINKIFNLFYRSENELTRETVGTGIGLALVQQLTTAMNGKISLINQHPGAEFRLQFNILH